MSFDLKELACRPAPVATDSDTLVRCFPTVDIQWYIPKKKGWVYKRGNSCVSRWKTKWAVLYDQPSVALYIYDKRDHPEPKYIIKPESIQIYLLEDLPKGFLENTKQAGFVIVSKNRKNDKDREEWIQSLKSFANPMAIPQLQVSQTDLDLDEASDSQNMNNVLNDAVSVYSAYSCRSAVSRASSHVTAFSRKSHRSRSVQPTTAERRLHRTRSAASVPCAESDPAARIVSVRETYGDLRPLVSPYHVCDMADILSECKSHGQSLPRPVEGWNERHRQFNFFAANAMEGNVTDELGVILKNIEHAELVGSFQEQARCFGKKIIDSFHTDRFAQECGDQETFIYGDILFQFSTDYEGERPDLVVAQEKRASLEINAINAIELLGTGVNTALMTVLTYKGFRMIAFAIMPLDEERTLVVNLDMEPPKADKKALQRLAPIAKMLNLKTHLVNTGDRNQVETPLSVSAEIHHVVETDELYCLHLCDIFPIDKLPRHEPVQEHRFRPELVKQYKKALSSDAFLQGIQSTKTDLQIYTHLDSKEDANDRDAVEAGEFLRNVVIPEFVRKLDLLAVVPIDSRGLTTEMHRHGINIRYLSEIYRKTQLPYVRDMCAIEIIARSSKKIVQEKLRRAIFHFRDVQASNIDEELISYTVRLFNLILGASEHQRRYWNENLKQRIQQKFGMDLDESVLLNAHKPALFHALQYHCGTEFVDNIHYDFLNDAPLKKEHFIRFEVKVKSVRVPLPTDEALGVLSDEEKLLHALAVQISSMGKIEKTSKNQHTAMCFTALAKYYLESGSFSKAGLFAKLASKVVSSNHTYFSVAQLCLLESEFMLARAQGLEKIDHILALYQRLMSTLEFHWGPDHPVSLAAHDKMEHLLSKADRPERGFEFMGKSLSLAKRVLGHSHPVTAGYMTKSGYLLLAMHRTSEALEMFVQALHIFEESQPGSEAVAENHYCIAESLMDKGDLDGALYHGEEAKNIRQRLFGAMHSKTVDSFQQIGKLLSLPYAEYDGVITPQIRKDLDCAIHYYERVFKFMKAHKHCTMMNKSGYKGKESILLTLTRTLISLKLRLIPSNLKDVLGTLRESPDVYPQEVVKDAILRLVHLTPSLYLEELFQRLSDDDRDALKELGTVMQIAEASSIVFMS